MTNEISIITPRPEGPDFVGVGVQKSGTSWLADIIAQHPEVLMIKKEINFFIRFFHKGYRWYHDWFREKNGRIAGEFTHSYMISPRPDPSHKEFYPKWNPRRNILFWRGQPSARDELKIRYPGIRVFAIFRNPIERAWSAYWFWRRRKERLGKQIIPFEKIWADDGRWLQTYGLYADYLEYWREKFPDFGVFIYDDIKERPLTLATEIYTFIGADTEFIPNIGKWVNKGSYEPMPETIFEMLAIFYEDQIIRFGKMIGRDISHWLENELKDYHIVS